MQKIYSPYRRLALSVFLSALLALQCLIRLRPAQLLPWMMLLQVLLFIHFISVFNLMFYAAGNVAVVCVGLLPMLFQRRYHWVR